MRLSNHAALRWFQRFPTLDIVQQWEAARRPSKRIIRLIKASNRSPRAMRTGKVKQDGRYYLVTPDGVVFVVGDDMVIITVLDLETIKG